MQSALAILPVLVFLVICAFLGPVLFRLMRPCQKSDLTPEWFEYFQTASYQPMQALLAADDFEFLAAQPGFDKAIYRKLRQDRLRIFREYLNRLILDFNRLHLLARLVISQSQEDHSALFARLISLRVSFWVSIVRVEFSYVLCRLGLRYISPAGLLSQLEEMSRLAAFPQAQTFIFG